MISTSLVDRFFNLINGITHKNPSRMAVLIDIFQSDTTLMMALMTLFTQVPALKP